jgi:hypothetical protein
MRLESAGCDKCSSSAAALKLPSFATETKARKSGKSKFMCETH